MKMFRCSYFLLTTAGKQMQKISTDLYCCGMAAWWDESRIPGSKTEILAESTANFVRMCKWEFFRMKCVFAFSVRLPAWKKKKKTTKKNYSTTLIQILSSHPVQEFKLSWVCFFFWLFFCFSSLFLSFSLPSGCFSLRCWRFLFLLRSCTVRSCQAS